jgi:poly-gamma-glutamate synthesis protein (capsule biosynthesis protein)
MKLCLTGDVMTGRGIDQILPHPSDPRLQEGYVKDARDYVALAEQINGPIEAPVGWEYVWGEALPLLRASDARIINLETSITRSNRYWRNKGIHYRMHPDNIECLRAAGIDCCVLANNHVLDWGVTGLEETLAGLGQAGIRTAGAGLNLEAARVPAVLPVSDGQRVLVFAYGSGTSGIPDQWAAGTDPGINLLADLYCCGDRVQSPP